MSSSSDDIAELRQRITALEQQIRDLGAPTPVAPPALPPPVVPPSLPPAPAAEPKPRRELNSTVLVASIGGFIFLLGAIWGLTVSIQRGWISPLVRVGLGNGIGLGFVVTALWLMGKERRRLGLAVLTVGLGTSVFANYYGGIVAQAIYPAAGFGGAVVATLVAGWIAVRHRLSGAMVAGIVLAVISPHLFWDIEFGHVTVLAYFLVILLAQGVVYYLTQTGARWWLARWAGLGALTLVAVMEVGQVPAGSSVHSLLLLIAIFGTALLLVWLPRHREKPSHGVSLTALIAAFSAWGGHKIMQDVAWGPWAETASPAAIAVLMVVLIPLVRRRLDNRSSDAGLAVIAAGFSMAAVIVARDGVADVLLWAAVALAGTLAARFAPATERRPLLAAASLYLAFATLRWWMAVNHPRGMDEWPFLNSTWIANLAITLAWWQMATLFPPHSRRWIGLVGAQVIFVHGLAMEWVGRRPLHLWPELPLQALMGTLTYALAGLSQWYAGVRHAATDQIRPLRVMGYVWIALAVIKLFVSDLAGASTESRAIAALVVGGLFIAAALLVDRFRLPRSGKED